MYLVKFFHTYICLSLKLAWLCISNTSCEAKFSFLLFSKWSKLSKSSGVSVADKYSKNSAFSILFFLSPRGVFNNEIFRLRINKKNRSIFELRWKPILAIFSSFDFHNLLSTILLFLLLNVWICLHSIWGFCTLEYIFNVISLLKLLNLKKKKLTLCERLFICKFPSRFHALRKDSVMNSNKVNRLKVLFLLINCTKHCNWFILSKLCRFLRTLALREKFSFLLIRLSETINFFSSLLLSLFFNIISGFNSLFMILSVLNFLTMELLMRRLCLMISSFKYLCINWISRLKKLHSYFKLTTYPK